MVGMPDPACRESRDRVRAAVLSSGDRVAEQVDHGQPRAGRAAQVRRRARPRHRRRRARRRRPAPAGVGRRARVSSASSVSTARSGGCRAWRRWSPCSATSTSSCPIGSSAEAHVAAERRGASRVDARGGARRARRRRAVAARPGSGRRRRRAAPRPISPTSGASPSPGGRSRSPPPAATTSCSSVRRAPARRCSPNGSPGSSRRSTATQALEATMVHSAAGVAMPRGGLVRIPPFRAPHHTSSVVALVGGGSHTLRPGRDQHRPRRRALPRRAGRIRPVRARRVARAA